MMKALPLAIAVLVSVCSTTGLRAADMGDGPRMDGTRATAPVRVRQVANACARVDILSTIVKRYGAYAPESHPAAIVEIRDMHLRRTQVRDRLHLVGRDYCGGTALTSDGVLRPIWYLIERDFAFAAMGSGVEYCLRGLDPTYVYGADCASLK